MFTPRSILSKSVSNATQKFDGLISLPHQRNLREMMIGMIIGESSRLTTIGNITAVGVTPRKNTERYARALEKIDVSVCTNRHIACASLAFRSERVLLLGDGGDFQKKHAKVMEQVCSCVDGSDGHSVGKGYPTFACVAYGLESKKQLPLCHHLYSTVDEDFKSAWEEQKKSYERLTPFLQSTRDRIVVEDRGCDDEKRFLFFVHELRCSFLTRINTGVNSRVVRLVRNGEISDEVISIQNIAAQMQGAVGAPKEWKNKKLKKKLTSRITFQEVRLPRHEDIPLFLVLLYTEGFSQPMVLLTDQEVLDAEKAWTVFFWYKKRWEVENFFRAIKQEFGAEDFLIRSFPAIQALAFVQMLAFCLLLQLKEHMKELMGFLGIWFSEFCHRWQRAKESHIDLLHWIREAWHISTPVGTHRFWSLELSVHRFRKRRDQLSMFSLREKW